jgi:hypothetical protein
MDPKHDRERETAENPGRGMERDAPLRRDENEAVPEFERGTDLDRGQDERADERESER